MKIYKLSAQAFLAVKRRILILNVIVGLVFLGAVALSIASGGARQLLEDWQNQDIGQTVFSYGVFVILGVVVVGVALVTGMRRALQQQRAVLDSFQIELGTNYIARQQLRVPRMSVRRMDVTELQETDACLFVRTADKSRTVGIPKTLEGYEEVRQTLSEWAPIHPTKPRTRLLSLVTGLVTLAALGILFLSLNLWLVLAAGIGLVALFGYFYWQLRKSLSVDPHYRRNFLFLLGWIVFISVIKLVAIWMMTPVPVRP